MNSIILPALEKQKMVFLLTKAYTHNSWVSIDCKRLMLMFEVFISLMFKMLSLPKLKKVP